MEIVIITPYWIRTKGGITIVVYYLSNNLKSKGYLVQVLTPDEGLGAINYQKID